MSGGYASKRSMASGRNAPMPMPRTASSRGNIKQQSVDWPGNSIQGTKMKISFRQRFRAWLFEEADDDQLVCVSDEDSIRMENDIKFSVVNAHGGRIVQVHYYDQKLDRNKTSLHIITPDEDLATALAHIFALETIGK